MAESRQAWDEVGERFTALGRKLKEHFDKHAEQREPVEDALKKLSGTVEAAVGAVGDSVGDPAFRDEAMRAATSFAEALRATIEEARDDIKGKLNRGD